MYRISTAIIYNLIFIRNFLKKQRFLFLTILNSTLLSANTNDLNTFESDFTQNIINDQNTQITYHGKLYAKTQNNQALWIYTSPINKKIYYTKGSVVIIEPELEQVIFAKLDKVPNILSLLKSAKKVSHNKLVTIYDNTEYKITVDGETIKQVDYKDMLQNRVTIMFTHQKNNQTIHNEKFLYHIPEDYDILEQK